MNPISISRPEQTYMTWYLKRDKIVPIIGHDILYCETKEGDKFPFQHYIVKYFQDNGYLDGYDDAMLIEMRENGYRGMSLLANSCCLSKYYNIDERSDFENLIEDAVSQVKITIISSVIEFLEVLKPELILTTSPFPVIEKVLLEKGLVYNSSYFSIETPTSGKFVDERYLDHHKSVVHLFGGTQDKCNKVWASNERRLICYLHSLHTYEMNSKLRNRLEGCRLWVMGCNLPEWLFQFLLFPLKGDQIVAPESIWFDHTDDNHLDIIDHYFSIYSCNARNYSFLDNLTVFFRNKIAQVHTTTEQNEVYDFFISYRDIDKDIALSVANVLKQHGCSCWIAPENDLAGIYWEKIISVLENTRHLVPIITTNYLSQYAIEKKEFSGKKNVYSITEALIKFAEKHKKDNDTIILPVRKLNDSIFIASDDGIARNVDFFVGVNHYVLHGQINPYFDTGNLNYYYWDDSEQKKDDPHSIYSDKFRDMCARKVPTMNELGESISNYTK